MKLPSVNETRNRTCVREVFKCLNGIAPMAFQSCFTRISHQKCTRGNKINLTLPKFRTEGGRKRFAFQGALVFNKLPNDLKTEQSLLILILILILILRIDPMRLAWISKLNTYSSYNHFNFNFCLTEVE